MECACCEAEWLRRPSRTGKVPCFHGAFVAYYITSRTPDDAGTKPRTSRSIMDLLPFQSDGTTLLVAPSLGTSMTAPITKLGDSLTSSNTNCSKGGA